MRASWQIVAKRTGSTYHPGRSRAVIKTPVRRSVEAKIVALRGGPRRGVAASILAAHDPDGQLRIICQVGSGLAGAERIALYNVLSAQPAPGSDSRGSACSCASGV